MARPIYYMQLYNQQHDPVFMELSTGKLHWTLSNENLLSNILFVSHISDDGKFYYENVDTNVVQWELPKEKMGLTAVDVAEVVIKINRKMLEKRVGSPFDLNKSNQQMLALDTYLRNKDALKEQQHQQGGGGGNSFLQAAVSDDDDENERYDSVGPMKGVQQKNPFMGAADSSDEDDDDRGMFSRNTLSSRGSTLKTTEVVKKSTVKVSTNTSLLILISSNSLSTFVVFFSILSVYLINHSLVI